MAGPTIRRKCVALRVVAMVNLARQFHRVPRVEGDRVSRILAVELLLARSALVMREP